METELTKFIRAWSEDEVNNRIHLMALRDHEHVYGLELRSPATMYNCPEDGFVALKDVMIRSTGGALRVTTSWSDFRAGVLSISVAFCNHGYSDKKITRALKILLTEIIPSFKLIKA